MFTVCANLHNNKKEFFKGTYIGRAPQVARDAVDTLCAAWQALQVYRTGQEGGVLGPGPPRQGKPPVVLPRGHRPVGTDSRTLGPQGRSGTASGGI